VVNVAEIFKVEGFEELNKKLKRLPDAVKRTEILKIQRRLAVPAITAYRAALPTGRRSHTRYTRDGSKTTYTPGNLARSVGALTVGKRASKGNPSIAVRPEKRGKSDGYYRFMVVKEGFKGVGRGSRIGANTVVPDARDRALATISASTTREAEIRTAAYVQKQIDKLS
jgi:hypothetical protein